MNRKRDKIAGIYRIMSIIDNSKLYVGSTINLHLRKYQHFSDLKYNRHGARYMQNHYNKHGVNSLDFDILELCSEDRLVEREQFWIDLLNPCFNTRIAIESNRDTKRDREQVEAQAELIRKFYKENDGTRVWTKELCDKIIQLKREGKKNKEIANTFKVNLEFISTVITGNCKHGQAISTFRKLNETKVKKLKKLIYLRYTIVSIAEKYGLSVTIISHINRGLSWKNVPFDPDIEVNIDNLKYSRTGYKNKNVCPVDKT